MLIDKTFRDSINKVAYVIVVKQDGVLKYVPKNYCAKHLFTFTTKLENAMQFDSAAEADQFAVSYTVPGLEKICIIITEMRVLGSAYIT